MMPKSGDNWHVHISVSRRDITNTFSLSTNANGRGSKKHILNGKSVRIGFDREAFKIACEQNFDRLFVHSRLATESYEQAKRLRKENAFAYAKQLAKDRAIRHQEALAFRQLGFAGYQDYYSDLLQRERLDGRQLFQLKGFLARQLHAAIPSKSVNEWMDLDLEELRPELAGLDIEPTVSPSYLTQSVAARIGDKTLEISGLQGYHPVTTGYRQLRRGFRMRQAFDQHREAVDRWTAIYSDQWYRENYRFESIGAMQRMDTLQAQAAFLNKELGESVLLANAQEHAAELERQHPAMRSDSLQKRLAGLFKQLKEIRSEQQERFDRAIAAFLHRHLPDYHPIIEKQTQLERLIEALAPSPEEYPEKLAEANHAIAGPLSPRAERIFEKEGQRLFGPDTHLKNETDFVNHIPKHVPAEQAKIYEARLEKNYANIEEERRTIIRQYADRLLAGAETERVDSIRFRQDFVNRFIDRKYAPKEAKRYKEDLQRAVAAVCRHPVLRETEYKVFDLATQKRIAVRAAAKVGPVRLPVSPPMLALKTASKLLGILTKGY